MLAVVSKVVPAGHVALWCRFLDGLWWSGLRLSEALALSWDSSEPIAVIMQPGYHPALRFQLGSQKAKRAELVPMAPEFAELLEATPEAERHGRVFCIPLSVNQAGRIVSAIGRKAGVVVDEDTGKPATAHDYRRAFGTRWSKRIMPAVLKRLMRHKDINTTLKYYVDQDAEDIAADLWAAYDKAQGNISGNSRQKSGKNTEILPIVRLLRIVGAAVVLSAPGDVVFSVGVAVVLPPPAVRYSRGGSTTATPTLQIAAQSRLVVVPINSCPAWRSALPLSS